MASLIRLLVGVPIAGVITLCLFIFMNFLINRGDFTPAEEGDDLRISINDVAEEINANRREANLDEVEDVVPPPPPPQIERQAADQPNENMETVVGNLPEFDSPDLGSGDVNFDVSDRDAQPLVRIPPQYPPRALERGLEGTCAFTFDVTADGTPTNIRITSCDSSVFERATIRAVERWRYEPKIVDGVAVGRTNVVSSFDYTLED